VDFQELLNFLKQEIHLTLLLLVKLMVLFLLEKSKRGNREIIVETRTGDIKKLLVKLSNQILVQENDFVKAGMPLSWFNNTKRYIEY
jgi:hypothetical protein